MAEDQVIIVGSGPTAAAAAVQLANRSVRCIVVNDGRLTPPGLVVKLRGRTVYRRDRCVGLERHVGPGGDAAATWFVSSALGGLSNYWTAATPRFDADDFDVHGRSDVRWQWPVDDGDVAPWYDAAETILELTAAAEPEWRGRTQCVAHTRRTPGDWQEVMRDLPFDCQLTTSAIGPPNLVARRAREHESYRTVLRSLERTGRIRVVAGLHVRQVLWDATEDRVRGVEADDVAGSDRVEIEGRHVLLCAGTTGTVPLLHRSRSARHPHGIGNENDLLGRYVTDHPRLWYVLELDRSLTALDQPLQIRRPATDQNPYGWQQSLGLGQGRRERVRAWLGRPGDHIGVNVFGTQLPDDRQSFRFGDGHAPLRSIEHSYARASIESLTGSSDELCTALASSGIGSSVRDVYVDTPGESVHWSGGARMHDDPAYGVVDSYGRVHDAPSVSVCDASVFTTLPEKNPTLTSMALAMRAADRVADDLLAG